MVCWYYYLQGEPKTTTNKYIGAQSEIQVQDMSRLKLTINTEMVVI